MLYSILHRGPDSKGFLKDNSLGINLGFCRLSFQDLSSAASQPMVSKNWILLFNGEIYNFKDLRSKYQKSGFTFESKSDTEVILAGLELHGLSSIKDLDGMFGIAAYNKRERSLTLARDKFGEKPLYYLSEKNLPIVFASELRALEKSRYFQSELDLSSIMSYLLFQYIPSPRSIYKYIKKVPPGKMITFYMDGSFLEDEATFNFYPGLSSMLSKDLNFILAKNELRTLLQESIERRLISDAPLGSFLSSGVDSSLVTSIIKKDFGVNIDTFSVGFEGYPESEHFIAKEISQFLGTEHHELIIKPNDFTFLDRIGSLLDEPLADSSCLPVFHISKYSRQFVKGIITGDGGDELFGGYPRYGNILGRLATNPKINPWSQYFDLISIAPVEFVTEIFNYLEGDTVGHIIHLEQLFNSYVINNDVLGAMRYIDSLEYLPGAVLAKVDRMSMLNSLETRTPFLERNLATFASNLPGNFLVNNNSHKLILRSLLSEYLPERITQLPKKGFGIPLTEEWTTEIYTRLEKVSHTKSGLSQHFEKEFSQKISQIALSDRWIQPFRAWSIVALNNWLEQRRPGNISELYANFFDSQKPLEELIYFNGSKATFRISSKFNYKADIYALKNWLDNISILKIINKFFRLNFFIVQEEKSEQYLPSYRTLRSDFNNFNFRLENKSKIVNNLFINKLNSIFYKIFNIFDKIHPFLEIKHSNNSIIICIDNVLQIPTPGNEDLLTLQHKIEGFSDFNELKSSLSISFRLNNFASSPIREIKSFLQNRKLHKKFHKIWLYTIYQGLDSRVFLSTFIQILSSQPKFIYIFNDPFHREHALAISLFQNIKFKFYDIKPDK